MWMLCYCYSCFLKPVNVCCKLSMFFIICLKWGSFCQPLSVCNLFVVVIFLNEWLIDFVVLPQELSKIAMPVVFNEPLSFLQRISEYMEHTHLIHKACSLSDSIDRMQVEATHCQCILNTLTVFLPEIHFLWTLLGKIMNCLKFFFFLFLSAWTKNKPKINTRKAEIRDSFLIFAWKMLSVAAAQLWFTLHLCDRLLLHLLFRL